MMEIDQFPTHEKDGLKYRIGHVFPFGASIIGNAVNFSIFSMNATSAQLLLFHRGENKPFAKIPFPEEFRIGGVYSMLVFGIDIEDVEYGYVMDGPYDPARGLLFDKNKILLDPYAHSVTGREKWGKKPNPKNPFQHRGRIILEDYDWESDKPLEIPQKDLVIYEMHVRSFTRHESSGVKHGGTFHGIVEKIPYLKELGVNCIELLPIFEFDELENTREYEGNRLYNYWGYSTVNFFAPKAGYAVNSALGMEADELKNLVKKLHQNGIEILLDVVFNHTAEGNENGPYISYKGIDNRTYYLMTPDGYYYNFSGCGNTLNCNNAVVRNCILDCLRYWVSSYHIDGFRFDLAAILSRDESGAPMTSPPLLEALAHDAVLGRTKLIAEAWDAGGLYQVGSFPSWNRWAEWNGKYRDCVRHFIKGDGDAAPELYWRVGGSWDMYSERSAEASINFITCHDGFTLYDLVSYNEKHNIANGEDGRDGCDDNISWNCGAEGSTEDDEINQLRARQMKNALIILLTSRGVPMLLSGDEFANTQFGNNNAYCQDNEISWLDWGFLEKNRTHYDFVRKLIAFRKAHPVIRNTHFDMDRNGTDYPELSFHSFAPWQYNNMEPSLTLAYMYAEDHKKYKTKGDAFIYVALNAHWEGHSFGLPVIPEGFKWHIAANTFEGKAYEPGREVQCEDQEQLYVHERSSVILIGKK